MAKPCTTLIGGKEYSKHELMAAIAKGEFEELLGKQTNKALSSVEETAKALEGKEDVKLSSIVDAFSLPLKLFHWGKKGIKKFSPTSYMEMVTGEKKKANGVYFTADKDLAKSYKKFKPDGELYEASIILKNPKIVKLNKDTAFVSDEKLKEYKEQGYDGLIYEGATGFDEVVVFNPESIIRNTYDLSEAYHRAKADGSNPELVKAVEDLLAQPKAEGAKETAPEVSKQAETESKPTSEGMVGKTKSGGKKKTIATERAYEGKIRDEVKGELEKMGLTRPTQSMGEAESLAKEAIKTLGLDTAYEAVKAGDIVGAPAAEIYNAKLEELNNRMSKSTDEQELQMLASESAKIWNEFSKQALEGGQFSAQLRNIYEKSDLGYSYEKKVNEFKEMNGGEIPAEVEKKFKELDEQLKETDKKLKEAEERLGKLEAERAVKDIKESVSRKPKKDKKEEAKALIGEGINDLAEALGVKLMAVGDKRATIVTGLSKIGKGLILNGEATIENVAQKVREYVNEKFNGKFNFDEYEEDFNSAIKEGAKTEGKVRIETSLIRDLIAQGIDNIDDLVSALKERIKVEYPNATDREIRDAITGYGKTVNPSKDEVSVRLRKIKDIGRIVSAIEDIEQKKRPLRSGQQMDKLDAEQRAKRRELREALKTLPIEDADLDRQIKTQLDTAKQRLQNQIEDLERQIESGEKDKRVAKTIIPDEELQQLKSRRDELKKEYDEKFKDNTYEEQKRLELTKRATERRIAELQRRLKEGDFSKTEKRPVIEDTELSRLRAEKIRIKDEYDKEFYKQQLRNRDFWTKAKDYAWDAWGLTRALSATADLSFVLVQGLVNTVSHPLQAAKAFKTALEFSVSEKKTEQWLNNIKAQEWYPILKQSGLSLTEPSAELTAREELFNSGWTNMIWDAVGMLLKLKGDSAYEKWVAANPMKALERASVGYLDTLRVQRFLDGMQMLQLQGKDIQSDKQAYKNVADVINTFTGRASLGSLEQNKQMLTKIFFSPRNWASILKQTILLPRQLVKWQGGEFKPSVANKMAISDLSKFVGLTSGMVALAAVGLSDDGRDDTGVETDPTSTDFGKIKYGDTRVDPWGGRIQQIILMSRLIFDSMKRGEEVKRLGEGRTSTKEDLLIEQAFNKLSPSAQMVHRYLSSRYNSKGEKVTKYEEPYSFSQDLLDRLHPIIYDTLKELLKEDLLHWMGF